MRIWKVVDPERAKSLNDLIDKVNEGSKNNIKIWEDIAPFEFTEFYSHGGFNICGQIDGVIPVERDIDLPVGWRRTKDRGVIPDGRRKEGKEALRRIEQETIYIGYKEIHKAIRLNDPGFGRFNIPQVRRSKDGTEVFAALDGKHDLEGNSNFEEVTISYLNSRLK